MKISRTAPWLLAALTIAAACKKDPPPSQESSASAKPAASASSSSGASSAPKGKKPKDWAVAMDRAVASIGKAAKEAKVDPKKKENQPLLLAVKKAEAAVDQLKKATE